MLALTVLANAQVKIFAKSPTGVLTIKAVQKDLNLSDEQVAGIKKIQDDFRSTVNGMMSGGFSGGSQEDLQAQLDAESSKLEKKALEILTESQRERLTQLELQVGPPNTILNSRYGDLNLTEAQKTKIKALHEGFLEQSAELQQSATDPDELAIKRNKLKKSTLDSIEDVLDATQKETLKKLKGEPLKS